MRVPGVLAAAVAALAVGGGCRQEMYDQPKYQPLERSSFYSDSRASRPLIEGTVARGALDAPNASGPTAMAPAVAAAATTLPMPLTRELVLRGRNRYAIFCTPCHDSTGSGAGMVVRRGYRPPPSLHIDRLRDAPVGQLYDVITRGLGAMPDYAQQIPPDDRWAIVAYVKALQLSQRVAAANLPPEDKARVENGDRPRFSPAPPPERERRENRGLSPNPGH